MELAAEAHVAVPEPESVITPEAAADRAAPERGPGSATAAQGEAGQEPPPQGEEESTSAVQEDLRQKKSVCKLRNLYSTVQIVGNAKIILIIINFLFLGEIAKKFPLSVHLRRERMEALGGTEKRRAGEAARAGKVHEDIRDGHFEAEVRNIS